MKPIELEIEGTEQLTFAKHQPEYQALPCVRLPNGDIAIKWQLDEAERDLIWNRGAFYLTVKTFNQPLQPLMPMADEPKVSEYEGEAFFYSQLEEGRLHGFVSDEWLPDSGLPAGYRDKLTTNTNIHFSFWDRVKILFGWKVELRCKTYVQHRPGRCYSESNVMVYRDRKLPQGWGEVMAAPMEDTDGNK